MREYPEPGWLSDYLQRQMIISETDPARSRLMRVYKTCGAATELDYDSKRVDRFDILANLLKPLFDVLEWAFPNIDWRNK
jgi:hypothetical protein